MDERDPVARDEERTLELREEELVAHKRRTQVGHVTVRTEVDSVPSRMEVEALHEEVEVVHEPVGQTVSEREQPHEEGDELVVPVYEEQLVVTKRLVLRERLHVRRVSTTERQVFEDTVRRERLVIDDPQHTGRIRDLHPTDQPGDARSESREQAEAEGGFLTRLVTRALE